MDYHFRKGEFAEVQKIISQKVQTMILDIPP